LEQWKDDHFQALRNTLKECLSLIRFYYIFSVNFYHKVKPFAQILPENLYENILHHYRVPCSHKKDAETKPVRGTGTTELLNSRNISQIDSHS
jgi:hypothetical protein